MCTALQFFAEQNSLKIAEKINHFHTRMFKGFLSSALFFHFVCRVGHFTVSQRKFTPCKVSSMYLVCASLSMLDLFDDVLYAKGEIFNLLSIF